MKKEKLTVETNEHGTITYHNADGKLHNPHGPAFISADGYKAYLINDKKLTEAEFTAWQAEQAAK